MGLGLHLGLTGVRPASGRQLSFAGAQLPAGMLVTASSLASGFGPDGLIAWPAHNLISPTDQSSWQGWSGSNGGTVASNAFTMPNANSTWNKNADTGVITTASGDKLVARAKFKALDPANVGNKLRLCVANNNIFTEEAEAAVTLTATDVLYEANLTCLSSRTTAALTLQGAASNRATNFSMLEPQLARAPMSPTRFVSTNDATSPYAPTYAELFDHFQTTGVRRGLRVRSGVDTATLSVTANGLYDVTYYWLDTDQTTLLSQTVTQSAAGLTLTLSPPVGEHILRLSISNPIEFTLNEFSINGLAFGISGATTGGSGGSAPIRLSGRAPVGAVIQARVRQGASVIANWHTIGTTTSNAFAFKTTGIPRGTGYTAEIRLAAAPTAVLTMTNNFAVGDVFVQTGNSLMNNWNTTDKANFTTAFQAYNGGNPVTFYDRSSGGSQVLSTPGSVNVFYAFSGTFGDITTWHDFGTNNLGAALESLYDELGGEVTGILDACGGNDGIDLFQSEGARVYRLAHSRKWEYPNALSGRMVPIIQQQFGMYRKDTQVYFDDFIQLTRRNEYLADGAYAQAYRGADVWDVTLADQVHITNGTAVQARMGRSAAVALGYTTGVQVRGPYVASAAKTSSTTIVAQVNISRGGTAITPTSGIVGFRVTDDGAMETISGVSVGAAVGSLVPVTITIAGTLTGAILLYHHYGNGLDITSSTDVPTINALVGPNTAKDNGPYALPLEWLDAMTVT